MIRSLIVAALVSAFAGCAAESDHGPVRPGGGGGAGGGGQEPPDAGIEPDGSSAAIAGFVCPILDLRFPTSCDSSQSAAGLDVVEQVSGSTATSSSGGEFSVATTGETAVLVVASADAGRRTSVVPATVGDSSGPVVAPVMSASDYDQLVLVLGVSEPDDTASVVVYARSSGLPVPDVNVVAPAGTTDVYYDSDDIVALDPIGPTENLGTVVMFGVPPESGLVDFTVVRPDQTTIEVRDVPALGNATTFVQVEL